MRKTKYDIFRYTLDVVLFVFLTILYMQIKKVQDIQKSIRFNFRSDVTATVQISQLQKENNVLKCKVIELEDKLEKAQRMFNASIKQIQQLEDQNDRLNRQMSNSKKF